MKNIGKPAIFIVATIIIVFTMLSIVGVSSQWGDKKVIYVKGVEDIRWGIDIRGGVDVTFAPPDDAENVTPEQMNAATSVIKQRLVNLGITDSEVYTDTNKNSIIVRFPWKSEEEDFDAVSAVKELGETAQLTFREGYEVDDNGAPKGTTKDNIILTGTDVKEAKAVYQQTNSNSKPEFMVSLTLNDSGKEAFSEATAKAAPTNAQISIWMDETCISAPTVNQQISDGQAVIQGGNFTAESANELADKINGGALPFKLETKSINTISSSLGMKARDAMALSGVIAFILVCAFMIYNYRLPGVIACIGLIGHVGGSLAAISGFFAPFPSFTLTLPGIAGIILGIGMGVDANILTASRIKEELDAGKSIDGAISTGFKRGFTAILDGNLTVIIVAIILMGAFGPPTSIFAKILSPVLFMFSATTEGAIYSFGYTLLIGVLLNFLMGVTATRIMIKSISRFKRFRNPKLYGGAENV